MTNLRTPTLISFYFYQNYYTPLFIFFPLIYINFLIIIIFMKELVVDKKFNNKKLDVFLYDSFPSLTRNILYKALRKKDILVNNKRINSNINVFENDIIKIYICDELLEFKLDIIFEDDNILVVNKPSGIETIR